jgi:PDZ domain/Aspartyl protease
VGVVNISLRLLLAFSAAVVLLAGAAARADTAADVILAANRTTVADPPPRSALTLVYRYDSSGLTGTLTDRIDLASGAYVETRDLSGVTDGEGFDGMTPWQRDISNTYIPERGGDRNPTAIDSAYRRANLWWRADHKEAAVLYIGRETESGRTLEHLAVTPRGGKRFDAWFDQDSHLLARATYDTQYFHYTEIYSDYRREGPQILPHQILIDQGLGPDGVSKLTLIRCNYVPAQPLSAYSQPNPPLTGAVIAGGAPSTTVPFRLFNNHIFIEGMVNGKGPYTFQVDTGGETLLSPQLIKEVGLHAIGQAVTSGNGEGQGTTGYVHYDQIAIGNLQLSDQIGFATDIFKKGVEGIPVDGMVGFELIRRMVTTIDYERHVITFTVPDHFSSGPELGLAVPFVFYDTIPTVTGRIGDLPARLKIDTGARISLAVTSPFVAAHGLRDQFAKGSLAVTGWGVGGPTRSYSVRMPSVAIGSENIPDAVVELSMARGGNLSDPNFDGNIGGGILKRFVVTFDYAHQMMYLKRISPAPLGLDTFDRSGLWINAHGDGYEVMDVAAGSAAASAGLALGDLINTVDGQPVTDSGLADTRQAWRAAPPGTRVELTVKRGAETRAVTLILRDQI